MAWQLHYTSAEAGPGGRAGFQFVAESPGLPPGLAGKVAAHLSYKPPPAAPLAPTPAQVADLPVALSYGPVGELSVLTRCVYLGQDYSGRYGNFLGHAVVAGPGELTGLRPVEFWRASLWSDAPAASGTALPELADPLPGDHLDPESLAEWLAAGGDAAYTRLGGLLSTVAKALSQGHGRVVLVCDDVEEIVRWIAVISYSLPWPVAARLPFLTYSADPATATQVIVGTTPDVWMPSDIDAAVVRLSEPPAEGAPLGRFARTVTECWRRSDLAGIDAIGELGATPAATDRPGGTSATTGRPAPSSPGGPSVTSAEHGGRGANPAAYGGHGGYGGRGGNPATHDGPSAAPGGSPAAHGGPGGSSARHGGPGGSSARHGGPSGSPAAHGGPGGSPVKHGGPGNSSVRHGGPGGSSGAHDGAGFDLETGAALLAFCQGDPTVTAEERSAIARSLTGDLPDWLWQDLGRMSGEMDFELASAARAVAPVDTAERCAARCAVLALRDRTLPPPEPALREETRETLRRETARALAAATDMDRLGDAAATAHAIGAPITGDDLEAAARTLAREGRGDLGRLLERVPPGLRDTVLSGVVLGVEEAAPDVLDRMLDDAVCDELHARDLSATPRTGTAVVLSRVRRELVTRVDATVDLIRFGADVTDDMPHGRFDGADVTDDTQPDRFGTDVADDMPHDRLGTDVADNTPQDRLATDVADNTPPDRLSASVADNTPQDRLNTDVANDTSPDRLGASVADNTPHGRLGADVADNTPQGHFGADVADVADVADDMPPGRDEALRIVWDQVPGIAECTSLVARLGTALNVSPYLSDLPARTFLATGLADPETVRLAGQVRDTVPGYPRKDAEAVLLATGVADADRPEDAAELLRRLDELGPEADEELLAEATAVAARSLTQRDPRFRTEVVKDLPESARTALTRAWLEGRRTRDEQVALIEVAIRLHLAGSPVPGLDAWARSQIGSWSLFGSVESHFKRDAELTAGLREMSKPRRARPWKRESP
ncbi:GAP1-N2 domain-containing protein [Sphaerisporangium corydalis]|uniref:Uncharacterized protein n=1 Tax=Sphaerisporangium corydalis TaxID=1441875 RepID=A0ABV9ENZ0_9ACTN|nr:hypothetical protein [Sphaerisporangium corydalis]